MRKRNRSLVIYRVLGVYNISMNLILLPGNNKNNRLWIDAIDRAVSPDFTRTAVHYYDHWWTDGDEGEMDLDAELLKLASTVQEFDKYVIFAKSAGVILALYGIFEGVLDPEVCIFVGSAVNWAKVREYDLDNWLINFDIPSLFIQSEHDSDTSFKELEELLIAKNVTGYRTVQLTGNEQSYEDTENLKRLTAEFYEV